MGDRTRAGVAAARILERQGVRFAFGVPGESFLGLLDGLYETDGIQLIATRHEGGAAFMAEAVGKLTGMPAICMGTRGVGTANLTIGIHTAYQDSTPLIAMVGQVETPDRHKEAFQEVELAPFLGEITKWAVEVPSGDRLPDLTNEAFRRSVSGRPGPVALALRGDILDEEVPAELPKTSQIGLAGAAPRRVDEALVLLRQAERPVIVAGAGVLRAGATDDLVRLAEAIGMPVMTAFRRHDVFPNDHPLFAGSLSIGAPPVVVERARNADVIVALGTRLGETTTFGYTIPGEGVTLIQIDASPAVIGRTYPATVAMVADAGVAIRAMTEAAKGLDWPDRTVANEEHRAAFERATDPAGSPGVRSLVDPALVIGELNRQLPPDAVITCDAGNYYGWLSRYFKYRQPGTFLGPISGAMGYAVPSAVAAALVRKNRVPVVAMAGDGGFLMTASELAVAVQHGLRVTCVVFNNNMYGTIRLHQERAYPDRVAGTDLASPDFVKYVEAFGGIGVRIEDNADITDGVRKVLEHDGIGLLEVAVDQDAISVNQTLEALRASRQARSRMRKGERMMSMSSTPEMATVAELFGLVHGRFREAVQELNDEVLNWSPGPEMNSIAVLVTHTLGSELDTLHRVRGMQMDRDRDAEFAVTNATKDELLAALDRADERLAEHAGAITEEDLGAMRERPGRDPQPGRRWLLDNYGHAREHVGHMEMAVQLWKTRG